MILYFQEMSSDVSSVCMMYDPAYYSVLVARADA